MRKTIYIEPSEDIINIVKKIKKEKAGDIFLVIPEGAVLVKGLINLEILRRETKKQKKEITFVTSDAHTKKILQDLDLKVAEKINRALTLNEEETEKENFAEKATFETIKELGEMEKKERIGSSSYFSSNNIRKNFKEEKNLIGDASFFNQEKSLPENEKNNKKKRSEDGNFFGFKSLFKEKEAENFFNNEKNGLDREVNKKGEKDYSKKGNKFKYFIFFIVFLLVLSAGAGWIYLNLPKVEVIIYPRQQVIEEKINADVIFKEDNEELTSNEIRGSLEEIEILEKFEFNATGEKFSSDQGKATGEVKIINKYSSVEQSLVATTRVLSREGKLFRLAKSTVVPGMKDEQPGEILVKVVADQPGEDFNIEPSSFTIEGFKGSAKYEKFEVVSEKKMTGGSGEGDNKKVKYVTEDDIDQARKESVNLINEILEEKIQEKVGDRKFLFDSVEKEVIESFSSAESGDIRDNFDFVVKEKVRVVVFKEEDLKSLIYSVILEDAPLGYKLDNNSLKIDYLKNILNKENKKMALGIEIVGLMWPKVDMENIKKGIAGRKEAEMQDVFKNYSEIKKVEIEYRPAWLKILPITEDKINIREIQEK